MGGMQGCGGGGGGGWEACLLSERSERGRVSGGDTGAPRPYSAPSTSVPDVPSPTILVPIFSLD